MRRPNLKAVLMTGVSALALFRSVGGVWAENVNHFAKGGTP